MRTGRTFIVSARRVLGLVAAIAAASRNAPPAPTIQVSTAPASPHLLYHR
jgi:hypothetical protein